MQSIRIAFFGTPELCVPLLEELKSAGMTPVVIITNPDRPVGRKQIITPSPVKIWAQNHTIPVLQPEKLDENFKKEIEKYNIDLSVVVAYGKIMPEWLITLPTYHTINIHYSLLPKYRGASPVESALLNGDTETGVCIQKMVYAMDAGAILTSVPVPLDIHDTATTLFEKLNTQAKQILVPTIKDYINQTITPLEQVGEPTFCHKIQKGDGEVDIIHTPPLELWNKYRAYHQRPGIFFFDTHGKRVKITQARFDNGTFIIEKIIREGEKETTY